MEQLVRVETVHEDGTVRVVRTAARKKEAVYTITGYAGSGEEG